MAREVTFRGIESPPEILDWSIFDAQEKAENKQGQHRLFVGPTQSGKTTLARMLARHRKAVIVLGTKPVDKSLDAYIIEGYKRIEAWPPTKKEIQEATLKDGSVRLLLWPKMTKREDLRKHRDHYLRCMEQVFVEGRWTLVADEGLWLASRRGLDLDGVLADIAYGAASNLVSLYLCIQRPAGLSRVTWSSVTDAYVFHLGVTNDVRELASLGTHDPTEAKRVVQGNLTNRQFLKLPCRGGAVWTISEVDAGAARPVRLDTL